MTKGQLLKAIEAIPMDADITIGKCVVIDEEANLTGILELPICGFGYDQKANEVHFLLHLEAVKKMFRPDEITFLKDIPAAEHDFHNPIVHSLDDLGARPMDSANESS
jgi:hypothetical protein